MHYSRIIALLGAVLGVVGLFMPGLNTDGEAVMPALNAANPAVPDGVPTIWGGLDTWAQVVVVIILVAIAVFALRPPLKDPEDNIGAGITTLAGVAFLIYAVIKLLETNDDATALKGAFAQAAEAGAIPAAFDVSSGYGFYVIIIGAGLVAIGGVLSLIAANKKTNTAAA